MSKRIRNIVLSVAALVVAIAAVFVIAAAISGSTPFAGAQAVTEVNKVTITDAEVHELIEQAKAEYPDDEIKRAQKAVKLLDDTFGTKATRWSRDMAPVTFRFAGSSCIIWLEADPEQDMNGWQPLLVVTEHRYGIWKVSGDITFKGPGAGACLAVTTSGATSVATTTAPVVPTAQPTRTKVPVTTRDSDCNEIGMDEIQPILDDAKSLYPNDDFDSKLARINYAIQQLDNLTGSNANRWQASLAKPVEVDFCDTSFVWQQTMGKHPRDRAVWEPVDGFTVNGDFGIWKAHGKVVVYNSGASIAVK